MKENPTQPLPFAVVEVVVLAGPLLLTSHDATTVLAVTPFAVIVVLSFSLLSLPVQPPSLSLRCCRPFSSLVGASVLVGCFNEVVLVIASEGVNLNAIEEELNKQCQSLLRGEFAGKAHPQFHSFMMYLRS
ncbi:hypothetical protein PIB30_068583 [Stylosanthes scabra]|uniref:Uncharacterized protein n=1 Tax=Stylosanthes scabra TaxID=79078 RepID=A0ABU6QNP0_9FABA|nr:hypothetical protein [Stylosanthes scabra]